MFDISCVPLRHISRLYWHTKVHVIASGRESRQGPDHAKGIEHVLSPWSQEDNFLLDRVTSISLKNYE